MTHPRFLTIVGALCLAAFVAVWQWQTGGFRDRLTPADVDAYLAKVEQAPVPAEEKAGLVERLRSWGASDDGRPFFMLNLMRYHDRLRRWPGAPEFAGTPRDSNAWYESHVMPIALKLGALPLGGGTAQGRDALVVGGAARGHDIRSAELDDWDRILFMRYPSRRAFFELVTSPDYLPYLPYKLMALQVVLVPVATEAAIPEPRWVAGFVLLSLFLAVGWWRSARRPRSAH